MRGGGIHRIDNSDRPRPCAEAAREHSGWGGANSDIRKERVVRRGPVRQISLILGFIQNL